NRIATEYGTKDKSLELTFYGSSFIADQTGVRVAEADRQTQSVLTHTFDLDEIDQHRRTWGVYRDRRPECYDAIGTLDGVT
ncbi:MAG: nitrilase-related carbon-nitrogen hydrolase, partial [Pseudomonadota bacterium]